LLRLQLLVLLAALRSALLLWLAVVTAAVHDAISGARNAAADQLQSWASAIAARSSSSSSTSDTNRAHSSAAVPLLADHSSRRQPPGFCRQFWWCLTRQVLMRTREPVLVFIEYAIFAVVSVSSQQLPQHTAAPSTYCTLLDSSMMHVLDACSEICMNLSLSAAVAMVPTVNLYSVLPPGML
jgi:hypothetical protein